MKEKLTFRNVLLLIVMMLASATITSCNSSDDNDVQYIEDNPLSTGLCGTKWVLKSITNNAPTYYYEAYVFDVSGNGTYEYIETEGSSKATKNFTWKSYTPSDKSLKMLELDGTQYTFYAITENNHLHITPDGYNVLQYIPEEEYNKGNTEGSEEEEK